jgi:hypothetical protein
MAKKIFENWSNSRKLENPGLIWLEGTENYLRELKARGK